VEELPTTCVPYSLLQHICSTAVPEQGYRNSQMAPAGACWQGDFSDRPSEQNNPHKATAHRSCAVWNKLIHDMREKRKV
jgi:hypothetical protein